MTRTAQRTGGGRRTSVLLVGALLAAPLTMAVGPFTAPAAYAADAVAAPVITAASYDPVSGLITVAGQGTPGANVNVGGLADPYNGGSATTTVPGSAIVGADGTWIVDLTPRSTGGVLHIRATHSGSEPAVIDVDTTTPAPVIASASYDSTSMLITVAGTGVPGLKVNVVGLSDPYDAGSATTTASASAVVGQDGSWSAVLTPRSTGGILHLRATHKDSAPAVIDVDTSTPAATTPEPEGPVVEEPPSTPGAEEPAPEPEQPPVEEPVAEPERPADEQPAADDDGVATPVVTSTTYDEVSGFITATGTGTPGLWIRAYIAVGVPPTGGVPQEQTVQVAGDGSWRVHMYAPVAAEEHEQVHFVQLSALTGATERSDQVDVPIHITPVPNPVIASRTYDALTDTIVVSGTGIPGMRIKVTDGPVPVSGETHPEQTVAADGSWRFTFELNGGPKTVWDDTYVIEVQQWNNTPAGHARSSNRVSSDGKPEIAAVDITSASYDPITGYITVEGTGTPGLTAAAGSIDKVGLNGLAYNLRSNIEVDTDGVWSVEFPAELGRTYDIFAMQRNSFGRMSENFDGPQVSAVIPAPVITSVTPAYWSTVTGTGIPGLTIEVRTDHMGFPETVAVEEDGTWSIEVYTPVGETVAEHEIRFVQMNDRRERSEQVTTVAVVEPELPAEEPTDPETDGPEEPVVPEPPVTEAPDPADPVDPEDPVTEQPVDEPEEPTEQDPPVQPDEPIEDEPVVQPEDPATDEPSTDEPQPAEQIDEEPKDAAPIERLEPTIPDKQLEEQVIDDIQTEQPDQPRVKVSETEEAELAKTGSEPFGALTLGLLTLAAGVILAFRRRRAVEGAK